MKNLQESCYVTPYLYGSFKAGDSTCSCIILFACAPMQSETWRQYTMSCWHLTRIQQHHAILYLLSSWTWFAPMLFSFRHGLSHAVTFCFCAVIFTRLWSYKLCCNWICVSAVLWFAPTKMGWSMLDQDAECTISLPWSLLWGLLLSGPNLGSHAKLIPVKRSCNTPIIIMWANRDNAILN